MTASGFNHRLVARLTGTMLTLTAAAMALPVAVSLYCRDGAQYGLALSAVLMLAIGLLLRNFPGRNATYELHGRESFWITAFMWIVVPLCGALPYLLTGTLARFTDAAFESVSGFSTTGSSVIADPQAIPQGLLLWRALTQWIGGLGLILFLVATVKQLQTGSLQLYDAEFSGTQQRKLHPHISKNVSRMWRIYALLTVALAALLAVAGNGLLPSVCLAMSTVSTGGFMTHCNGLQGYSNLTLDLLTLFMFLSGINVAVLYNLFTFHWRRVRRNDELRVYLAVFFVATALCTLPMLLRGGNVWSSARHALFHVASTISTCGYYVPDHSVCVGVAGPVVTFLLIVSGAMAGSTGGGLKLRRLMTLALYLRNYFTRMLHPNAVFTVKIDRQVVSGDYVNKVFGFVFLYILFIFGGAFVLTLTGCGIADSFCLAAANLSNLGPSPLLNSFGTTFQYVLLPATAKWALIILMLAGRLEIFALLAIVSPSYWRKK